MSQEQADDLKRQLASIIPDTYTISVKYSRNISEAMHVIIGDMSTEACKVTYHNSERFVQLIMHMDDRMPAWEILCGRGIPFRKLSPTKNATASERLIGWAKRTFND